MASFPSPTRLEGGPDPTYQSAKARKYGPGFRYFNNGISPMDAEFLANISAADRATEKEKRDAME